MWVNIKHTAGSPADLYWSPFLSSILHGYPGCQERAGEGTGNMPMTAVITCKLDSANSPDSSKTNTAAGPRLRRTASSAQVRQNTCQHHMVKSESSWTSSPCPRETQQHYYSTAACLQDAIRRLEKPFSVMVNDFDLRLYFLWTSHEDKQWKMILYWQERRWSSLRIEMGSRF